MNIESTIDSIARVENAGGLYYFAFPYTSAVGVNTDELSVRVPISGEQPSAKDKQALLEAVSVQGALGEWVYKEDGTVWLVDKDHA